MATAAEEREWRDPRNWRGGWLGVYVAPRDPRVWVPKRRPAFGWTLNFAHRTSWIWLAALLLPGLVVAVVAIWTT
jgi:uncharacterized membrane protein